MEVMGSVVRRRVEEGWSDIYPTPPAHEPGREYMNGSISTLLTSHNYVLHTPMRGPGGDEERFQHLETDFDERILYFCVLSRIPFDRVERRRYFWHVMGV
jgi:hypothetical protein